MRPESKLFPFGGISIALIELGFVSVKDVGGARYYRNPDGSMTMEMKEIMDEEDSTKPLSHTFKKEEWELVRKRKKKVA